MKNRDLALWAAACLSNSACKTVATDSNVKSVLQKQDCSNRTLKTTPTDVLIIDGSESNGQTGLEITESYGSGEGNAGGYSNSSNSGYSNSGEGDGGGYNNSNSRPYVAPAYVPPPQNNSTNQKVQTGSAYTAQGKSASLGTFEEARKSKSIIIDKFVEHDAAANFEAFRLLENEQGPLVIGLNPSKSANSAAEPKYVIVSLSYAASKELMVYDPLNKGPNGAIKFVQCNDPNKK